MLNSLLPNYLYDALAKATPIKGINELRLRVNRPIRYLVGGVFYTLYDEGEVVYATSETIDAILSTATSRSMYAYNDQISRGYIAYKGGIRIGLAGEGVENDGKVTTIKSISYLVIRVPNEIKGVADIVMQNIGKNKANLLIISPPGGGKTTLLRDYVRQVSNAGHNVLLIDERGEVASTMNGMPTLDVGSNTDVITGTDKTYAYKMAIRSLSPDILATDEVFGRSEVDSILDIIRSGINVVATIHGKDIKSLSNTIYSPLIDAFNYVATISLTGGKRIISVTQHE